MSEFNREDRYIVIKRSDLTQDDMAVLSDVIHDRTIKTRDCVVVESHWPNYEQTWQTIQQVAEGTYKPAAPDVSELEPVGWQFFQDGRWWNGFDNIKDHRKNTEEAGFPVRDLYTTPPAEPDVSGMASPTPFERAINRIREASASIQNAVDEWDDHIARTERSSPLPQAVHGGLLAHLRSVILCAHSAYQGDDSPENKHLMGLCMEALVEAIPDIDLSADLSAYREQQGGEK